MTDNLIKIGIAGHSDRDSLVSLLGFLFEQESEFSPNQALQQQGLSMIIKNPQLGEIIVLRRQGKAIGMVTLLYNVSTALGARVAILEDMVIHPQYRNQSYGTQLLIEAIKRARKTGCQRITLLSDTDNTSAQRFYQRNGFEASTMQPFRLMLSTSENRS